MFPLLALLACISAEDINARLDADGDGHRHDVDCDDENPAIHPDAAEVCNGVDDDCDGTVDGPGSADAELGFDDSDGDSFGGSTRTDCPRAAGWTDLGGDCDDDNENINPAATERCNEVDDDCDGTIDGPDSADAVDGFLDQDGDGFGATPVRDCTTVLGFTAQGDDCDDTRAAVNPAKTEQCGNGLDDDCNANTDCTLVGTLFPDAGTGSALEFTLLPFALATGDFNGDGYGDLFAADGAGGLHQWLGAPTGISGDSVALTQMPSNPNVRMRLADLDEDGRDDLIIDSWGTNARFGLWWGSQAAVVNSAPSAEVIAAPHALVPSPRYAVRPGVSDHAPTLFVPHELAGPRLYGWQPTPSDTVLSSTTTSHDFSLGAMSRLPEAVCDLRTSGACDLLLFDPGGALPTLARLVPWPPTSGPLDTQGTAWTKGSNILQPRFPDRQGDLNGDGKLDLALLLASGSLAAPDRVVLLQSPLPPGDLNLLAQAAFVSEPGGAGATAIAMPDLDHDGQADVAVLVRAGDAWQVRVAYGPGPSTQRSFDDFDLVIDFGAATVNADAHLATGDVNGDGSADLIAAIPGAPSKIWVFTGQGI